MIFLASSKEEPPKFLSQISAPFSSIFITQISDDPLFTETLLSELLELPITKK